MNRGFFSATTILLAITIIALAASLATLEQSHSQSQVLKLRNQILLEKHQDAIEITRDAAAQIIAAAGKQQTCEGKILQDELNTRSAIITNALSNVNLSTQVDDNLELIAHGANSPFTVDLTANLETTLENAKITKQLIVNKKLAIVQNADGTTLLNVSDLNTGLYKEFLITC